MGMIKITIRIAVIIGGMLIPAMSYAQSISLKEDLALTEKQINRLNTGKPIVSVKKNYGPDGKTAKVTGLILIDATPDQIWTVLIDCPRATEFVPGLKSCEVLDRATDGTWEIRRHVNDSRFLPKMVSEFRNEFEYPRKIRFNRTGGDLSVNQGEWRLTPIENSTKTLVSYNCTLAADTMIPDSMVRKSIKNKTPKVLRALEKEVMADMELVQLTNEHAP